MSDEKHFEAIKQLPENERARQFIRLLFNNGPCCEGLEDLAIECGIVEQVEVSSPCSDDGSCTCEAYGFFDGRLCNVVVV